MNYQFFNLSTRIERCLLFILMSVLSLIGSEKAQAQIASDTSSQVVQAAEDSLPAPRLKRIRLPKWPPSLNVEPETAEQLTQDLTLAAGPALAYSTYFGFEGDDAGNHIAVDSAGNAYITGSILFAADTVCTRDNEDVVVLKFDPTGTKLLYGARFGGCEQDQGNAIAVDSVGNVYVTGLTRSNNFPVTANAYSKNLVRSPDAFVTKLDTNAPVEQSIIYSTFFNADEGRGIAVDANGQAYITGQASWGFPTTPGAFQPTCPGCNFTSDAFVAKFDFTKSGTASLVYSTYLGGDDPPLLGSGDDVGHNIKVDSLGQAVVVGGASSTDFPLLNPIQASYQGGTRDVFVTKLNASGSGLIYSTLLGTDQYDSGEGVALDSAGNAYVTGITSYYNFPTTPGAYQTEWNIGDCSSPGYFVPCTDAFVAKISASGKLVYSTYLGGHLRDYGNNIAVDSAGYAYISGYALSYDFPIVQPLPSVSSGASDAFIAKLNPQGSALLFSTYLGGSGKDESLGIAARNGNIYVVGNTEASDFPLKNPVQSTLGGGVDAFIAKITDPAALLSLSLNTTKVTGGRTATATVTLSGPAPTGGAIVNLSSSNTAVATVPTSVTVADGKATASFPVTTKPITSDVAVKISATYQGITKTSTLTVKPTALSSLTLSSSAAAGSKSVTGKVTLTGPAPSGGIVVTLTDTLAAATAPASVSVAAGASSAVFTINTVAVTATQTGTVTASYAGVNKAASMSVRPIGVASVTLTPSTVTGGSTVTATVTLEAAAAPSSITVTLSSSNATVASPTVSSISIPAGTTSKSFSVRTVKVTAITTVSIKAMANGISQSKALTLTP